MSPWVLTPFLLVALADAVGTPAIDPTGDRLNFVLQITSIVGTLSTIILGVIAIWLSLYLYKMSNQIHASVTTILSRVEASTKATEVASKDVLHPVIETILGVVRESMRSRIDTLSPQLVHRATARLQEALNAQTPEQKETIRQEFLAEFNDLIGTLRQEVEKVSAPPVVEEAKAKPAAVPGSPSYNWTPFVRRVRDLEEQHQFLSVKWLREKKFASDPEAQEALQVAIDRSMLSTYYIDNPKNPNFPTLCCKLNREHPVVRKILDAITQK